MRFRNYLQWLRNALSCFYLGPFEVSVRIIRWSGGEMRLGIAAHWGRTNYDGTAYYVNVYLLLWKFRLAWVRKEERVRRCACGEDLRAPFGFGKYHWCPQSEKQA